MTEQKYNMVAMHFHLLIGAWPAPPATASEGLLPWRGLRLYQPRPRRLPVLVLSLLLSCLPVASGSLSGHQFLADFLNDAAEPPKH